MDEATDYAGNRHRACGGGDWLFWGGADDGFADLESGAIEYATGVCGDSAGLFYGVSEKDGIVCESAMGASFGMGGGGLDCFSQSKIDF